MLNNLMTGTRRNIRGVEKRSRRRMIALVFVLYSFGSFSVWLCIRRSWE